MPLLRGKLYTLLSPPKDLKPEEEVFVVKQTNEVCRSYDEYIEKVLLYTSQVWTCHCTGETNLDYEGALESEQKNLKLLEKFPSYLEKPILQTVHHSTSTCADLVNECSNQLHLELFEGERVDVSLDKKTHYDCVITKVTSKKNDEQIPSASSSPSSDKENSLKVNHAAKKLASPSKYKINTELSYEVRGENNTYFRDVSPQCLRRTTEIPSKKLVKLFIRSNAVLGPKNGTNLWVVQEHLVKKYSLPEKSAVCAAMEQSPLFETPEQASSKDSIEKKKSKKKQLDMPSKSENSKLPKKKPSSKARKPDPAQKRLDHFRIYLPKLETCSPVKGIKTCVENRTYSPVKIIDSPVKGNKPVTDDLECFVLEKTTSTSNSRSSVKKSTMSVPSSANSAVSSGSPARPVNKTQKNSVPPRKSLDFTGKVPKKSKHKNKSKPTSKLSSNSPSKSLKMSVDKSCTKASSKGVTTNKSPLLLPKMSEVKSPSKSPKLSKGKSPLKPFMSVNKSSSKVRSPSKSSELLEEKSTLKSPRKSKDNCVSKSPKLLKGKSPSKSPKVSTGNLVLSPKITKKRPVEDNGKGKKTPKKKLKFEQKNHNNATKKGLKKKSGLKQTTIFDMAKKSEVSASEMALGKPKSPEVWSLKVWSEKLSKAVENKKVVKVNKMIQESQEKYLIASLSVLDMKTPIRNKLKIKWENCKMKLMTEEERERAREEKKRKKRELLVKKRKERRLERKRQRNLAIKRYEDTELELQELPEPTAVSLPKEISLKAFGDVLMVVEFVSGLKMFLTPGRSISYFTSDTLMQALVSSEEGLPLLSKLLVALLQTLLQDEETEGKDIGMPLKEMPLTEYTAFELARLYLEHNVGKSVLADDKQDDDSDSGKKCDDSSKEEPANVMPARLLNLLKENEFYSAPAEDKLKVLVCLCNDVMASVSFEDYVGQQMAKALSFRQQIRNVQKEKSKRNRKEKERRKEEQEKNKEKKVEETTEQKSKQQTLNFEGPSASSTLPDGSIDKELDSKDNTTSSHTTGQAASEDGDEAKKKKVKNPGPESNLSQAIRSRKEQRALNLIMEEKRKAEEAEEFKKQQGEIEILKCLDCLRLSPLGYDRFHRRYWLFHGASPGLYVEDGWMDKCTLQPADNKTCVAQNVVVTDGKEIPENCKKDAAQNVVVIDDEQGTENCKAVAQSVIEIGDELRPEITENCKEDVDISKSIREVDYSWSCYETMEAVDNLLKCLAVQGTRESALSRALKENYNAISWCIRKRSKLNKRNEEVEKDGEEHLLKSLKDDMVDIAQRLSKGKLGEMENLDLYQENVTEAQQPNDLGLLLLELLESTFPRALTGGFSETGESKSKVKEQWKEAVKTARTFSRLHLLLDLLEEAVLWDKSTEKAKCKLCRKKADEENLLICCSNPECSLAYHLFCLRPSLSEMPKYSWLCPVCKPEISRSSRDLRSDYDEEDDDDQSSEEEDNSDQSSAEDSHEDYCDMCGEEGELVCCDTCPLVYHIECHDPPLRNVPRGEWSCCKCRWGEPTKSKSLAVSAAEKKKKAAKKNATKASRASRKRQRPQIKDDSESEGEDCRPNGKTSKRSCAAKRSLQKESDSDGSSDSGPTRRKPSKASRGSRIRQQEEDSDSDYSMPNKRTSKRTCTVLKKNMKESESDDESDVPPTRKNSNKASRSRQKLWEEEEDLSGNEGFLAKKRTSKRSHAAAKRNMKEMSEDDDDDSPPRKTKRPLSTNKKEQSSKNSNNKCLAKNKRISKVGEASKRTSTDLVQQESTKRHRTNPELEKCEVINAKLWSEENSWPFRAPVNPREVPDYAEVVSEPIDLSTVRSKLNTLQYESAESFAADIRLMFRNCEAYNLNTSDVGQAGVHLEKLFESLLVKEFPGLRRKSNNKRRR